MAGFSNREELLDLLLDDAQEVIQQVIYATGLEDMTMEQARVKLIKLTNKIYNYRQLNPKESEELKCQD